MNYNSSGSRRGKPKRILDPSVGLSVPSQSPVSPQGSYNQQPMYNPQQVPINNGSMAPEYQYNMGEQQQVYGGAYSSSPMQSPYSTDQQHQQRGNDGFPSAQFATKLINEPVVANMAMHYGNTLVDSGKEKIEKYIPVTALRYYFAVDTDYVFTKLMLLFFPFTHKDWSVKYEQDVPLQPRYERNAPDMYIPTMAFLTYVALAGLALGTQERFTPEQLGIISSSALAWGVVEMIVHNITLYALNLDTSLKWLDMLAYCGYKYVGINAAVLVSLVFRKLGYYLLLSYFSISLAFFLIRSLKLRVVPEGSAAYSASGNKRRLYFILFVAGIQPLLMWWLTYNVV